LETLREQVDDQLQQAVQECQARRVFVSVGARYWSLLDDPIGRHAKSLRVTVATGGIGGRASQLAHWLGSVEPNVPSDEIDGGEQRTATLLGTTVTLSTDEVLAQAREALSQSPQGARRFETRYVQVGSERVAPKWLVSILFDQPVSRFRTADARRVLSALGVECLYREHLNGKH
jgi:hypothetical protein